MKGLNAALRDLYPVEHLLDQIAGESAMLQRMGPPLSPRQVAYYERQAAKAHVEQLRNQHALYTGHVIAVETDRAGAAVILHYADGKKVRIHASAPYDEASVEAEVIAP